MPTLIYISSHQQVLTKKNSCEAELDSLSQLPTEMPKVVVLFPAGNSEVEKKEKKGQSGFWFRSTSESLTAILGNNGQIQKFRNCS